jgi:hypothetical protein
MRNEQGDTLLTALARRQTGGAASDEIPTLRPEVFSSLVLKLVEHGADLFERNADGENFFHVIARDHQSLALLKALLAAIEKKDVAASTSAQNGESGAGEADMDVEVDGVQSTPAADKKESIVKGSGEEETLPEQHRGLKAQIRQALQARNARGQTPLLTAVRPYAHAACHNTEVVQSRIRLLPNAHFALSILPPDASRDTDGVAVAFGRNRTGRRAGDGQHGPLLRSHDRQPDRRQVRAHTLWPSALAVRRGHLT